MENLKTISTIPKNGNEELSFNEINIGFSLLDFWKWSVSDLMSNATRGRLAEFIVGTSVGLNPENLRDEWDAYDITSDNGIKIEVKSASYIQSWSQREFSKISFSIKKAKFWNADNGMSRGEAKRHAEVYVFCLLKHKNQETIDPLKLEQWEFYVLPTYKLDNYERSQSSITINSLRKLTEPIEYVLLKDKIEKCYQEQVKIKDFKL